MLPALRQGLVPGAISALLYVLLPLTGGLGLVPGLLAPMPIIFAALSGGRVAAGAAVTSGALLALIATQVGFAFGYVVSAGLPGLAIGMVLTWTKRHEDGSESATGMMELVLAGTAYALIVVLVGLAYVSGGAGVEANLRDQILAAPLGMPEGLDQELANQIIEAMVAMIPGAPAGLIGAALIGNGIWAVRMVARRGTLSRPPLNFAALRLPDWVYVVFILAYTASAVASGDLAFMAMQVSFVLAMPLLLAGLSVVHAVTVGRSGRGIVLMMTYGSLLFGTWPAMILVLLGFADHIFGLKTRFGAQSSGKDEE